MSIRWRRFVLAFAIIVAGGALRLPLEQRHTDELRRHDLMEVPLNLSMREKLGQSLFIAVLGGFRPVVASIMELQAIEPWIHVNYAKVEECYAICTALQPREEHYWEERAWHQAFNARDAWLWDSTLTEANRKLLAQQCVDHGIDILREGLQWLPKSWKLWDRLAAYLSMSYNEYPDRDAAAEYYAKAYELNGRRLYWRLHVYEVSKIEAREREAWDKLIGLYYSPEAMDRTNSVERELLYHFIVRKIQERYPAAKLPDALFRFIDPSAVLTDEEKKRRAFLQERVRERGNPNPPKHRAPQVTSPHLQQVR